MAVIKTGRGNGLIPWETFIGPRAYFGRSDKAAMVDLCGNCQSPISIYFNHLLRTHSHNIYNGNSAFELNTDENKILSKRFRCRKCPTCRRAASRKWAERCVTEFNTAPRTWFGTFTISEAFLEECWSKDRNECLTALYDQGTDESEILDYTLTTLPPLHSQERRRVEAYFVDRELAKMWKRIRKAGHQIRYCVTTEFGKRKGRLHYHALVHCLPGLGMRVFEDEWKDIGYVSMRLCKSNTAAHYVAKYVAKDGGSHRVKASQHYGTAEKAGLFWDRLSRVAPH